MKKNKLLVAGLLTITFLVFSACQAETQSLDNNQQNSTGTSGTEQKTNIISLADQSVFEGARRLKDPTFCDKIQDENFKKQCRDAVNDQTQLEEAVKKLDAGLCEKISTKDGQDACKIQIEVIQKQKSQQVEEQKKIDQEHTVAQGIVEKGDYQQCKQLTVEGIVNDCEITILAKKAISTKDASWCDKASTDNNKQQCEDAFKKMVPNQ